MNRAQLPSGIATGIGSLPHRDAAAAAEFALTTLELPAIPTLPKRSPAEGMMPQALVGLAGITVGQYGSIASTGEFRPRRSCRDDLQHDAIRRWRAFLAAQQPQGPVKWQFVGPVTLGLALVRAGLASDVAFEVSVRAVRCRVRQLVDHVATVLPGCRQVVFIDEPKLDELMGAKFPIAPDTAVDLVSAALAAIEPVAVTGLHVCATADIASLVSIGPDVLSVPRHAAALIPPVSRQILERWLARSRGASVDRRPDRDDSRASVAQTQRVVVRAGARGADPPQLRQQSIITLSAVSNSHSAVA